MGRADGRDAHTGAVHRARLDLRAQVRRDPPACLQAGDRRTPALAEPAAAEHPTPCRGDRRSAGARRDTRRRGHLGIGRRGVPRVRRPLARWPRREAPAARRTPGAVERAAAPIPPGARDGARRREAVGARVQRRLGRRRREAAHGAVRAPPLAALAEDEVRSGAGARRWRVHGSARRAGRPGRAARRLLRPSTGPGAP
jgi:hypothetical protein